jgi:hypothetical protein
MTAGNVRRVKLKHNQPPHTGAAWSGTCRVGEEEENGRAGGGGVAGLVGGIGFSWRRRLATRALGDWGKRAQVSFLSKKKKKKKKGRGVEYSPLLFQRDRSNRRLHCDHIQPRLRSVAFLLIVNRQKRSEPHVFRSKWERRGDEGGYIPEGGRKTREHSIDLLLLLVVGGGPHAALRQVGRVAVVGAVVVVSL